MKISKLMICTMPLMALGGCRSGDGSTTVTAPAAVSTSAACDAAYVGNVMSALDAFKTAVGPTLSAAAQYDTGTYTTDQLNVYKTDWSNLPDGVLNGSYGNSRGWGWQVPPRAEAWVPPSSGGGMTMPTSGGASTGAGGTTGTQPSSYSRPGITLGQLSGTTQIAALNKLASVALSAAAYKDFQGVLAADDYLGHTLNASGYGPENYHVGGRGHAVGHRRVDAHARGATTWRTTSRSTPAAPTRRRFTSASSRRPPSPPTSITRRPMARRSTTRAPIP